MKSSKTLEEKIASLKDKAILSQKENKNSISEIIKLKAQINSLKTALTEVNLKLSQLQALFEKQKKEDEINKIETADALIKSKKYKKIIVVGVDKMSSILDYQDRNTCVLFGDGAGAVLFEPSSENGTCKSS